MSDQSGNDPRSQLLASTDAYMTAQEIRLRVGSAMQRGLPEFRACQNDATNWAVIGAGPSVGDCLGEIRLLKRHGVNIVSVNKTHDWLLENGIVPWGHVLLDGHEWVADYVARPRHDVRYFVASQCHDATFARLDGYPVFLWHAGQDFPGGAEPDRYFREMGYGFQPIIGGGTTVGQRVPIMGHGMGARRFHMIGFDSCRRDGKLHVTPKPDIIDPSQRRLAFKWNGHKWWFDTNAHMARQQMDFDKFIEDMPMRWQSKQLAPDFRLIFYGSGLTPMWAATLGLHANPAYNEDPSQVGGWVDVEENRPRTSMDFFPMPNLPDQCDGIVFDVNNPVYNIDVPPLIIK